jgi:hypothetical protein
VFDIEAMVCPSVRHDGVLSRWVLHVLFGICDDEHTSAGSTSNPTVQHLIVMTKREKKGMESDIDMRFK